MRFGKHVGGLEQIDTAFVHLSAPLPDLVAPSRREFVTGVGVKALYEALSHESTRMRGKGKCLRNDFFSRCGHAQKLLFARFVVNSLICNEYVGLQKPRGLRLSGLNSST